MPFDAGGGGGGRKLFGTGRGSGGRPKEIEMPRHGDNMKWRTKNDSRNKPEKPAAPPTHPGQTREKLNPLNALNKETRSGVENLAQAGRGIFANLNTTIDIFRPKRKKK